VSLLQKENSNFILVGIGDVADLVDVGGVAVQGGKDPHDALSCRSVSAKETLIVRRSFVEHDL